MSEELAQQRAQQPYEAGSVKLPAAIAHLTYDQYQSIRFRRADALWHNQSLFEVQFFHRGFNFDRRVTISEVVDGAAHAVPYNPAWFDFGKVVRQPGKLPRDLGFAGFRIHYPLHTPAYKDELIVFLGASFFRVLGRNQDYGLSARGLAINTAAKGGEEFPWFTDFWLVRPTIRSSARSPSTRLLDSESITGAYQFEVRPGSITQVQVTSELYPRRAIEKLGIAPLTSMFLYGEDPSGHRFDDYRPRCMTATASWRRPAPGEWLWRPLVNPHELRVNRFMDRASAGLRSGSARPGFHPLPGSGGAFPAPAELLDPAAGRLGQGRRRAGRDSRRDEEIHDNIVAVLGAGGSRRAPQGTQVLLSALRPLGLADVAAGRQGDRYAHHGRDAGEQHDLSRSDVRRVIIDFAGGDLDGLDRDATGEGAAHRQRRPTENVTVERIAGQSASGG